MIAIVDYGAGNLFSVKNALDFLHIPSCITADEKQIQQAKGLLVPGVGAFADAMDKLRNSGLDEVIIRQAEEKPVLGICLGMQLLFESGCEGGAFVKGLGLIEGKVIKIDAKGMKVPHMGWNEVVLQNRCPLTQGVMEGEYVYFVHSYRADTADENISLYSQYSEKIPALVYKGQVYGAQFHPEKSGETGLNILRNFGGLCQ